MSARLPLPPRRATAGVVVAAAALTVIAPFAVGEYWTKVLLLCVVYAVAAAGAQVLYGRLGFVSLNQIALVGVGGWVFLRVGHAIALPHPMLLIVAGLVTAAVGVLIGLPSLRLSGLPLALVTLMAAAAFEVVFSAVGFPNGGPGIIGTVSGGDLPVALPRPGWLASDETLLVYTTAVAAVCFTLLWLLVRSRAGRAWMAIGQSVPAALATGVDVTRYRVLALAATSFVTGVSGGLLATGDGRLDPVSFPAQQSIVLFAVVLIGGGYSLLGAALAGLLYAGLPAVLDQLGLQGNLILVVFGAGLVHSLVTAPQGIAGQLLGLARRRRPPAADPVQRSTPAAAPEPLEEVTRHA
ncbi:MULTISPECIES: branched-chain amino acid ABC transporter permease [unclassified Frankia]|uniref:branched-chain amino acid ABC transporter permease n=1 Tax=unclassified Frankia TaxID=2632575 RepID=UPI002AD430A3|nr:MULTISPECIES: branched-chain amino acid ABC transporter permease [unclassified Frankia]